VREPTAGELFIVDNSVSGWTGLRYLEEWCSLAKSFDIATGFFEVGSLLALDGKWQQLDKIRILMGGEVTQSTRKALLQAVTTRAEASLNGSIEEAKDENPFLKGVPAIADALRSGQIECRVYDKDKFHAKAYITHARMEVIGAQALVGSSNFTRPGLTQNVELNIQVQSGREVAQLQRWFEEHWQLAHDVTPEVLTVVDRHIQEFSPFDVYAKALHEYFKGHEITASEWEESKSRMFNALARYQREGYWALMKIAKQHGGAFLCDGVGLGKTFIGLMLIERLVVHENKRVVLFAPKTAKEFVWEPHLRRWLPQLGGTGGGSDFSNLAVFSHTDLNRRGDFPERFQRIAELADVVIIDEAHHFRNPGRQSEAGSDRARSRYYELYDLLDDARRPKTLFMLTATPINNRLSDFRHMVELFSRRDEAYFARTLGINNLRAHFNTLEKELRSQLGTDVGVDITENIAEAQQLLTADPAFQELVVQRSRVYAKESQQRETGAAAVFPERRPPKVAAYSIRQTYGSLLDMVEKAFGKKDPLFTLPVYYPLAYYKGPNENIDPLEENRQKQVVSLIRTQFLKRFESSVLAFELSCWRLMRKLLAFVEVHATTESERRLVERWKRQNAEILVPNPQLSLWNDDGADADDDVIPQEFLDAVPDLSREEYAVESIIHETLLDLAELGKFLAEARRFQPKHDDKLKKLISLLKSKDLSAQKVLIFTEFADTARYLERHLKEAGINGVGEVDSTTTGNRADVIRRFAPYYNATSSLELAERGVDEIRVLISTDVLSEGLNLQDATRMINYDIHWNPVRLMQRIGRVDRRLDPEIESRITSDHPEQVRGIVAFWNFLPPAELNAILSLYTTVTRKTLMISKTLGIEGRQLFSPEDDYEALRDFNAAYEGTKSAVEGMHLEYQSLLADHPDLAERLAELPGRIFSGRRRTPLSASAVFFCFALPALDNESGGFTEAAGTTRWYLYDVARKEVLEDPADIIACIRSAPDTARVCTLDETTLIQVRTAVLKHIKNTYLKRLDAPVGVKPALKCWMELTNG